MSDFDLSLPEWPNVRITATYPAVPFPCPESVEVELRTDGGHALRGDIKATVDALAGLPAMARAALDAQL